MKPAQKVERFAAAVLPVVLAAAVFAVAFDHVRQVAAWAGQPGWYSVVIASTAEVMAVASLLEIRARRAAGGSARWPVLVLVAAVGWSAACNLRAAAGLDGDPGAWRYVVATWTVAAFGLVAGIKATRGHDVEAVAAVAPVPVVVPAVEPEPVPVVAPEPPTPGTGATPRGSGRLLLAELVATLPADDPRSERQLAADLAPVAGLAPATARRYLADLRRQAVAA